MSTCPEFLKVAPGVATWSVYSRECKTHCFAHAHVHQNYLVLIDPILPATAEIWEKILQMGTPNLIILTNGNHMRQALKIANKYALPLAASIHAIPELTQKPDIILEGQTKLQGLRPLPCPGGGPGETALFSDSTGTLILGDSIIHLPQTGLQILPDKYCSHPSQLKKSLATLLNLPIRQILMAHGIPMTKTDSPKEKLRHLLLS